MCENALRSNPPSLNDFEHYEDYRDSVTLWDLITGIRIRLIFHVHIYLELLDTWIDLKMVLYLICRGTEIS